MTAMGRVLVPGVQVVVDRAVVVAHLRAQLGRLEAEAVRGLGRWITALDSEGDQQAEAINRVSYAIGNVEGDGSWDWSAGLIYALAVPFPRRRIEAV